jgi:hypothetical protein
MLLFGTIRASHINSGRISSRIRQRRECSAIDRRLARTLEIWRTTGLGSTALAKLFNHNALPEFETMATLAYFGQGSLKNPAQPKKTPLRIAMQGTWPGNL